MKKLIFLSLFPLYIVAMEDAPSTQSWAPLEIMNHILHSKGYSHITFQSAYGFRTCSFASHVQEQVYQPNAFLVPTTLNTLSFTQEGSLDDKEKFDSWKKKNKEDFEVHYRKWQSIFFPYQEPLPYCSISLEGDRYVDNKLYIDGPNNENFILWAGKLAHGDHQGPCYDFGIAHGQIKETAFQPIVSTSDALPGVLTTIALSPFCASFVIATDKYLNFYQAFVEGQTSLKSNLIKSCTLDEPITKIAYLNSKILLALTAEGLLYTYSFRKSTGQIDRSKQTIKQTTVGSDKKDTHTILCKDFAINTLNPHLIALLSTTNVLLMLNLYNSASEGLTVLVDSLQAQKIWFSGKRICFSNDDGTYCVYQIDKIDMKIFFP